MAAIRKRVRCHVDDANNHRLFQRQLRAADRPRACGFGARAQEPAECRGETRELGGGPVVTGEWSDAAGRTSHERPSPSPQARGPREHVGAGLRAPVHERLALGFRDVFDENDERLDPGRGEPGRLPFPAACRERRAHRFRCVRGERGHLHRSACTTCSRAARSAGKKPPTTPITTAKMSPARSSAGVTRKLNAISLKLDQLVVLVTMPLSGSANRQPSSPPMTAMNADSARKLSSTLAGRKPRVSSTPISGARDAIAAYIVLIAPKTAPTHTSGRPDVNRWPSVTLMFERTSHAWALTPRTTTFATCVVSNDLASGIRT